MPFCYVNATSLPCPPSAQILLEPARKQIRWASHTWPPQVGGEGGTVDAERLSLPQTPGNCRMAQGRYSQTSEGRDAVPHKSQPACTSSLGQRSLPGLQRGWQLPGHQWGASCGVGYRWRGLVCIWKVGYFYTVKLEHVIVVCIFSFFFWLKINSVRW